MFRSIIILPVVFVLVFTAGCSVCASSPYTAVSENDLERTPLGLLRADRQIPSQDAVFFSRTPDGRVYVISRCTPAPHNMIVYVRKADGMLWEQSRDQDFCIAIEQGDQSVEVFTVMDDDDCDDREEAFCEGRLSRDVLDL